MSDSAEQEDIIDLAIAYRMSGSYLWLLSKDPKRRSDDRGRQRAGVRAKAEEACANTKLDPATHTSGHLGTRKTWRTIAERFYWKGLS